MAPETAVAALAAILAGPERSAALAVADVDWARFTPAFTSARPSPLIADLPEVRRLAAAASAGGPAAGAGEEGAEGFLTRLRALPDEELDQELLDLVCRHAAAVLGLRGPEAIEAGRAFNASGFDSLTAVELRNRLRGATGLRLPTTLLFDYPTPLAAARYLRDELFPERRAAGAAPPEGGDEDAAVHKALLAIPAGRLREAGLLDALLRLAAEESAPEDRAADSADQAAGAYGNDEAEKPGGAAELDAMGLDDLVRMAFKNDVPDEMRRS
ncbi:hypothetical protein D7294_31255 [Streptomyces hoynatensis]|uniref:Carrier domain-containing protein n=2 Tax=Streptomyces hoynatensis TaxID=1141874 RepID=A0A3A9YJ67_9ACTN|nr:hypothetical protein D7294_31255 [Streptomyces hoynatensis]